MKTLTTFALVALMIGSLLESAAVDAGSPRLVKVGQTAKSSVDLQTQNLQNALQQQNQRFSTKSRILKSQNDTTKNVEIWSIVVDGESFQAAAT